ncbi:hypothetical protein PVAND_015793 [Polypedilum vanderplanki]|uniref:Uncharacterized protein n=1 Tax=Polypedilum vanderplanki TaxID=319348 RepID=A0A9J6BE02_POLVA|nr:hypothetical protein PVAND_015793 [Polypedilum vanderplanki]
MDCVYQMVKSQETDEEFYECKISSDEVVENSEAEFSIRYENHLQGKSNEDVQAIKVGANPDFYVIPLNFGAVFKNIIQISITYTKITKITSENLKFFPKLIYLDLCCNEIRAIEKNLFENNPDLETIDLNSNQINKIDKEAFTGLRKLRFLDLRENVIEADHATTRNEVVKMLENLN